MATWNAAQVLNVTDLGALASYTGRFDASPRAAPLLDWVAAGALDH